MYDTDLTRKDYSDTIRNALNVIQRYKFIFHLPQTIERSVKRVREFQQTENNLHECHLYVQEEYEKVINDFVRARAAFETVDSKVFQNSMLSDIKQSPIYIISIVLFSSST